MRTRSPLRSYLMLSPVSASSTSWPRLAARPSAISARRVPLPRGEDRLSMPVKTGCVSACHPGNERMIDNDECVQLRYSYRLAPSPALRIALAHLTQKMMPQSADRNQVGDVGVKLG
jgi:hypothetical protein